MNEIELECLTHHPLVRGADGVVIPMLSLPVEMGLRKAYYSFYWYGRPLHDIQRTLFCQVFDGEKRTRIPWLKWTDATVIDPQTGLARDTAAPSGGKKPKTAQDIRRLELKVDLAKRVLGRKTGPFDPALVTRKHFVGPLETAALRYSHPRRQ